ncbi:MAG: sigma-54 dependent transcriptional regulator [Planctomycetaceae bacterium]|nr:sigma-54 dependent transcriptional regulator [Planctomycetaceae bacterium]
MISISPAMRQVTELIDMVAKSDCCVLIEGESGTGKELVARRLHQKSPRSASPFIPTNCAGISETLFESQFFGHVRGAFTGADQAMLGLVRSAEGGTLFLDEVGEIPINLQPKLLRVLQDGEVMAVGSTAPAKVDTRFVAATNRSLAQEVAAGKFRTDLFHRLNVVCLRLLPLRERKEDIEPLLDYFRQRCAVRYQRPAMHVGSAVRAVLAAYNWPGNIRELSSWVERLYATGQDAQTLAQALISQQDPTAAQAAEAPAAVMTIEQAERMAIARALKATANNRSQAARILDINRATLLRKLDLYNMA